MIGARSLLISLSCFPPTVITTKKHVGSTGKWMIIRLRVLIDTPTFENIKWHCFEVAKLSKTPGVDLPASEGQTIPSSVIRCSTRINSALSQQRIF